jgi:hypothetical protein
MHQAFKFTGPKIETWNHCNRVTIPAAVCSVQGSQDVAKSEVAEAETSAALILVVTTWLRTLSTIRQNYVVFARKLQRRSNISTDMFKSLSVLIFLVRQSTLNHLNPPSQLKPPNSQTQKSWNLKDRAWHPERWSLDKSTGCMLVHCYRRPQKGAKKHHIIYNF